MISKSSKSLMNNIETLLEINFNKFNILSDMAKLASSFYHTGMNKGVKVLIRC